MKRVSSIIALLLLTFSALAAPSLTLEWGPSPDADVNNYRLYWGPRSGDYNVFSDLGNVTNTVFTQLVPGAHYFFVVTAMNAEGAESDPSNEIDFRIPGRKPGAPGVLDIPIAIEASHDLKNWTAVASADVVRETPSAFYRLRIHQPAPILTAAPIHPAAVSPVKAPFTARPMRRTTITPPPIPTH